MIRTTTRSLALATAVGLAFAVSASASTFSVSGAGGAIPDPLATPGTWNSTYTGTAFTSTVTLTRTVTNITKVRLSGLAHTWRGDLHIILKSPSASFNIAVRPGFTGAGFGDSGDYLVGTYDFVVPPAGSVAQGTTNISGGLYNQFFNTGAGQWTLGISNTLLSGIAGAAGVWTLEIRDWANADIGSLTGWTLEGNDVSGGASITPICFGDGSAGACPCANNGSAGNGCANSTTPGGANLAASGGSPSLASDTVVLNATNEDLNKLSIFVQGDAEIAPAPFFDGLRCIGGNLLRLFLVVGTSGTPTTFASAPSAASSPASPATISGRSAALGDPLVPGSVRSYQVYYRDNDTLFCPSGGTANITNGLRVTWGP